MQKIDFSKQLAYNANIQIQTGSKRGGIFKPYQLISERKIWN